MNERKGDSTHHVKHDAPHDLNIHILRSPLHLFTRPRTLSLTTISTGYRCSIRKYPDTDGGADLA